MFENVDFNLPWISNPDIINALFLHYQFCRCVYDDVETMTAYIQHIVDINKEYFEKLYSTTTYEYNPIENYSMVETLTDSAQQNNTRITENNNTLNTDVNQIPENTINKRMVGNTSQQGNDKTTETNNNSNTTQRTLKRSGNIGVTTSQQMIASERENILNLTKMYIEIFTDLFILDWM